MTELIPLADIGVAAALVMPFVVVVVEMVKAIGVKGKRTQAFTALLSGQAIALGHWWVAWKQTPESLFLAVLVGVAASAMAMKLWDKALKTWAKPAKPTT